MSISLLTENIPISSEPDGTLRVAGTRVLLDLVLRAFQGGSTPEEIAIAYPTLDLSAVYTIVGYYLRHQAELEAYLTRREAESEVQRHLIETGQPSMVGIRERLLARRSGQ